MGQFLYSRMKGINKKVIPKGFDALKNPLDMPDIE
jgi:hypothetical protein